MEKLSRKEITDKLRNARNLPRDELKKLFTMLQELPIELPQKEIDAMLRKPCKDRYIYSLKRIADHEIAWTLRDDEGIIRTSNDEGNSFFHIWPYKEYALKCMIDDWGNLQLVEIPLDELLNDILPELIEEGTMIASFEVPSDSLVVTVSATDFLNNLLYEYSQYVK